MRINLFFDSFSFRAIIINNNMTYAKKQTTGARSESSHCVEKNKIGEIDTIVPRKIEEIISRLYFIPINTGIKNNKNPKNNEKMKTALSISIFNTLDIMPVRNGQALESENGYNPQYESGFNIQGA
jgi:hypothetical protein